MSYFVLHIIVLSQNHLAERKKYLTHKKHKLCLHFSLAYDGRDVSSENAARKHIIKL